MQPTKLQTKTFKHKLHLLFRLTHDDDLIAWFRRAWKYRTDYDDIIAQITKEIKQILDNDYS